MSGRKKNLQRVHTFKLTLTFDKPCTPKVALREVRDCLYGDHYTTEMVDDDPGMFRIKTIKRETAT